MDHSRSTGTNRQDFSGIDAISQAIGRAQFHTQRALCETVEAGRALLDVASLGVSGVPAEEHATLREVGELLDQIADTLAGDPEAAGRGPLRAVLDALEDHIDRWEARSRTDTDARAVLRAFLGLREVLWELGLRPNDPPGTPERDPDRSRNREHGPSDRRQPARRSRVQHVDIQD